jgi:tripartite-type tricarboxylate transporter receptor subunit TctC
MRSLPSFWLIVAAFVFAQADATRAQANYPNRPIQLVVTVPPGGAADLIARVIGAKLSEALGQPVVINNRAGAGGTTAATQVAKSDPDGYTLLLNTIATHGIGPHIYANLGYDPVKDFSPVILVAKLPLIMVVNAEVPVRTVSDVIALAKAKPGELTFSSSGAGGAPHLAGEMFKNLTGAELQHIPYRGSGPAVIDLIAGRITMMFDATPSLLPNITAGKLVRRRDPRRHACADRAPAQCGARQDRRHARRPQELERPGCGPAGRHA